MKYYIKDIISVFYSHYSRVFSKKTKRVIYLLSFHRSGSTWVSEVMLKALDMGFIYEPLHFRENRIIKKTSKTHQVFFNKSSNEIERLNYFKDLNSKKHLSRWSLSRSSLNSVVKNEILLVKFIRANLFYKFFDLNFKQIEKIILIRNPFAVIESVLNGGKGSWNPPSINFLLKYYSSILATDPKLSSFIANEVSNSQRCLLLLRWCIEYKNILPQLNSLDNVFFYETLKESEEEQMKLLRLINKNNKVNHFSNSKRSSTTSKVNTISKNTTYWIDNYSEDEVEEIQKILNFFNVKTYSFDKFYPNK